MSAIGRLSPCDDEGDAVSRYEVGSGLVYAGIKCDRRQRSSWKLLESRP